MPYLSSTKKALLALLLLAAPAMPTWAFAAPPDGPLVIPFTVEDGTILVSALINGKPARLIVDTGASANLIAAESANALGVKADGKTVNASGAGEFKAARTTIDHASLGALNLDGVTAYVAPVGDGFGADGIIGRPLFDEFVVTLDYADGQMTLTEPGKAVAPAGALALDLKFEAGRPTVPAIVDGVPVRLLLDSGGYSALLLYPRFVERHHLTSRYIPEIEDGSSVGTGGTITTYLARIPALTLGDAKNGVTFQSFEGALKRQQKGSAFDSKDEVGLIGTRTLQHFTVTLDYSRRKAYFVKNRNFDAPFPMTRHGFTAPFGGEAHAVLSVLPNSPAADAGIKVGDRIVSVDGLPYTTANSDAVRVRLRQPAGTKVAVVLRPESGEPRAVTLILRDLL